MTQNSIIQFDLPLLPIHLYDRSTCEPVYSTFQCVKKRALTFSHFRWPIQMKQCPDALAKAGFIYTGHSDRVVCFNCGVGLQSWKVYNDPFLEHSRLNSECSYIKRARFEHGPVFQEMTFSSTLAQPEFVRTPSNLNMPDCVVCFAEPRSVVFRPCGHLATCMDCSYKIQNCVMCRFHIIERITVYS